MINQKKRNRPIAITPIAILKVPCTHIFGFSPEQNRYIQEKHRQVLRSAARLNAKYKSNSMEVVLLINTHTWEEWVVEGKEERVVYMNDNLAANQAMDTSPKNSLMLLHNHPGTGTFSAEDIKTFCNTDSLYIITVVGNDGTIYLLKKENNFDSEKLLLAYGNLAEKYSRYSNNATRAVAYILANASN